MKLLIFVAILVLVGQGKAAPSKDEVKEVQSELVDGYAVVEPGQEVGGVKFVEEAPAEDLPVVAGGWPARASPIEELEDEPAVAGAWPPRAFPIEDLAAGPNFSDPETVYIPMVARACTNSACLQICNMLGFANGVCVSTTTCQCF